METKVIVAVVVLLGAVYSVSGEDCCTPDQWQGLQGSTSGYVYKRKPGSVEGYRFVSYDYTNKRSAAYANFTTSEGERRAYRIVTRYDKEACADSVECSKGKMYVVDLQSNKCYTKKAYRPFRKACVPEKAKETGKFYFGAGEDTLKLKGYRVVVDNRNYKLQIQLTLTENCIPVGEQVIGIARGVPLMEATGFVDIRPGIKDPAVFDVPEQCQDEQPGFIMHGLDHEYSILAL